MTNSASSGSSVMADKTIPDKEPSLPCADAAPDKEPSLPCADVAPDKEPSLPCADVANVDPLRDMSSESLGNDDVRVKMEGPEFDSHLQLLLHA